ncbi:MAG: hypothetical protein EXR69_01155 [Myxococcales bacterium]|nr:hypothetical protein [Myxococcales bacterium]
MEASDLRLEELEVKVSYLEHQLAELDGLVRELFAANLELRRELVGVKEAREEGSITFGEGGVVVEKPPHY